MENRKVIIENMTNSRVGIDIPELRLMRVWEKKGVKKPVDFDVLKEAIYNEGVEYMFKTGILYIDDIDVKIELGLEESKEDLKIKYPYLKIKESYHWVDDVNSKYYNNLVTTENIKTDYQYVKQIKEKDFKTSENLIKYDSYKYLINIEYNRKGKKINGIGRGSAIFIHCTSNKNYTLGCIAINEKDMLDLLNLLDKNKHPKIWIK